MSDRTPVPDRSPEKPVDQWVTGDEPMTGPQQSYLETLAREAGEEPPTEATKAEASEMIDRLQEVTGRGAGHDSAKHDLVEPQGVNAGSAAGERDRRPSADIDVEPTDGRPVREGDQPAERLVGAPGQQEGLPGLQTEVGEG
jgi:hypothetical protein